MFGFLKRVLFWVLIIFFGGCTYLFFLGNSFVDEEEADPATAVLPQNIPSLDAILVQVDEATGNRRILSCSESGCTPIHPPASLGINPLSDGTSWYRYAERTGKLGVKSSVLEKVDSTGKVHIITEENPLVKPRAMMLSNDGTKIAYFLDNIHDKKKLTELWVYDSKAGGAKVIVEKLHRPDIASRVRWNASSRVTWFLQEVKKKELIVASLGGGTGTPRFTGIDWNEYGEVVDAGVMDMNDDMSLVAFAKSETKGFSKLFVARGNEASIAKSIRGSVVFLRWMENNGLLYAVQDGKNLTFWMANAQTEWPIARMDAVFESAHSSGSSGLVAFVASPRAEDRHLYVLQIATGHMKDETSIPNFPGTTHVVQTKESVGQFPQAVAGVISTIPDSQIVAFIEAQAPAIFKETNSKPNRILMTDIPNASFVDFTDAAGKEQRALVRVIDVVNPEWDVVARYKAINGIWNRVDASGDTDPKVLRLYEWEDTLSQWILKETY